ncbi:50S ribosome-binding GTPase [Candidatus Woesearchaeota archaeon]|nr:50S ribosome-binding GTPase [Candidatus Woesearchaeota archaeon]
MNFGNLGHVETADEYLDIAFRQAKLHAKEAKVVGTQFQRIQRRELDAIATVARVLTKHLTLILEGFPKLDQLDPFYRELVRCVVDAAQVKQSLGGVNWGAHRVEAIFREFNDKFRGSRDENALLAHKRAFFGRISSVIKKLKSDFAFLEEARRTLTELPSIKTSVPTVVIAGFPNVGKSTLLRALTGSAPEIAPYPFTTKQMMLGYRNHGKERWQFIDTPGLLDRPLHERNPIEKQAILALQHLADAVLFVLDPTESCGYSIQDQKHLMKEVSRAMDVPVIIVLNKSDLASREQMELAAQNMQNAVIASAEEEKNIDHIVSAIGKALK